MFEQRSSAGLFFCLVNTLQIMSSTLLPALAYVICTHIPSISAYYLSPNSVSWSNASSFCQNYCNSDLISIHSNDENLQVIKIADNSLDITDVYKSIAISSTPNMIWLGLTILSGNWSWSDGSLFDFGSNVSGGAYPWEEKEPNNKNGLELCVHILLNSDEDRWNDNQCYNAYRFMCNDCKGKLNKYVLIYNYPLNYSQAEAFCRDKLSTSLASIHDKYDQDLAANLCELTENNACYIGANDIVNEGEWVWSDGTDFNFGLDTRGSVWPWGKNQDENEPNDLGNEDCVTLRRIYDYDWEDVSCGQSSSFICNLPSEICKIFI